MSMASIVGKVIISGTIITLSPLLIGGGQSEEDHDYDIHVLKDNDENPFIPGTSIAGVVRHNIRDILPNFEIAMFGSLGEIQSSVNFDDIVLKNTNIIYRDGVGIDLYTGAGIDGVKYNYEAIEPNAKGKFLTEITFRGYHLENVDDITSPIRSDFIECVLLMRDLLKDGIRVGALTTKGFGLVKLIDEKTILYDFSKKEDIKSWFMQDDKADTKSLMRRSVFSDVDKNDFIVKAYLSINGSIIIRDYNVANDVRKNRTSTVTSVMMKTGGKYVIPGTSIKGVLRHQAEKIFLTTGRNINELENLMGNLPDYKKNDDNNKKKIKSRFYVSEAFFDSSKVDEVPQTRNRIDRFTGGVIDNALFTVKPIWQKAYEEKSLCLEFFVKKASYAEAGLMLFLLKDICQGKVAFGGEKHIGRGTFQGLKVTINYQGEKWIIDKEGQVIEGDISKLNEYANEFIKEGELHGY